ncbi:MAG: Tyrosine recombinase XerC [Chroococcopsis gigantea SAG 12.99]|nr:Tyrosine recombinase XerC [Chroococcopsis gigantea SAG 12.99]
MTNIIPINPKLSHLSPVAPVVDYDRLLSDWLATKRSAHTRRVYRQDIDAFLSETESTLGKFLAGDRYQSFETVSIYKGEMLTGGLKSATINRRLSAIKSLVSYAYSSGHCEFNLENVKGEKIQGYRDTSGIDADSFRRVLAVCDRSTIKGIRDYALLVLLWSNALRRSEVSNANIGDFDREMARLRILGKGRGEYEYISLSEKTVNALNDWLGARGETNPDQPLFCSVNPAYSEGRLSVNGIYNIVSERSAQAGINKRMSPHRVRHSSITAALDATGGDVRKVQKLSRHSNLNTLMIYDDNRRNHQGEVSDLLNDLI